MKTKALLYLILGFSSFCLFAEEESEEIIVEKFVEPFVENVYFLKINGHATLDIAVLIDHEGKVDDWVPIRTNDMGLVRAVDQVIDDWEFRPTLRDGDPVWTYGEISLRFEQTGGIVDLSISDSVLSFYNLMRDDIQIVVPFSELDRIPKPVKMEMPGVHRSLIEIGTTQSIRIEFFIDQEGKVRLPIIRELEGRVEVAGIVLENVMKWEFEPPMKYGKEVITRAVVPVKVR